MAESLSEKLGLPSPGFSGRAVVRGGLSVAKVAGFIERDRARVVAAFARWLMGQGYGGDRLTRGEVDDLIRRELLGEEEQ